MISTSIFWWSPMFLSDNRNAGFALESEYQKSFTNNTENYSFLFQKTKTLKMKRSHLTFQMKLP